MSEIEILKAEIESLKLENYKQSQELNIYEKAVKGVTHILGVTDENGKLKPELQGEDPAYLGIIIGGLGDTMGLLMKAKAPYIGRKYEEELQQKFSFVKELIHLIKVD